MRVLFVTNMWPDAERPWYGSFVYSQARSLRDLGIEVETLPIRGYVSKGEYARAAREMLRRDRVEQYDLVHAHYGHSAIVARLGWRRPLVVSYCGDDLLGTPSSEQPNVMTRSSRVLARAFAQVARVATATITKSQQMELALPRGLRHRNHVIPNGVDLDMFKPMGQAEARRRLGWAADEKVALFVGNPALPRKNHALAEQACALAAAQCPALKLRVAFGIPPEDVPVWMSGADVLIHPSWSEGSPNAVKEAMACELPVVATPAGDVPERLQGLAGSHVLEPDAAKFAAGLLDAIGHHPSAAARVAVRDLSLRRSAERVIGVYEAAVGSGVRTR